MEDSTLVAQVVVAVSLLWVCSKWIRHYLETKRPFPDVPMPDKSHWLLGHLNLFIDANFRASMGSLKAPTNQYGQVGTWAFIRPTLFVFDIKDAKTVLNKESYRFRPKLLNRHVARVTGERALLALNGKDWRLHRLAITKTFNPDFLTDCRQDMQDVTQQMVESIQRKVAKESADSSGLELDLEPLMKSITLGIFCKTALNVDGIVSANDMNPSPVATAFEYCIGQLMKRLKSPFWPQHQFYWIPTEQNRRQLREHQMLRSLISDLISEKRKTIEENQDGATDKDLLTHLLKAHKDVKSMGIIEAGQVTDDGLTDSVMSLFLAGYDTTSINLGAALYLLAQHPQAQEYCVREIQSTKDGLINPDALVYCKAVIWEALRMYPPAVVTARTMSKPMELSGGLVVPEGADVVIPIYSFNHDEDVFACPNEFRPDRWVAFEADKEERWVERSASDDTGDIPAANRSNMMSFSAGGRNCVGMKFATQEAVLVLANLLNGLEFKTVPGFEFKTSTKAFLHKPDNGVLLNVSARA
ncbi:Leukotriene-B(4) omega-hydroxylase 2 [Seminavis robusta]|uniref:Leukotriene-B(4) omega-hydroxylase 2 n=1 Tax=Seminavis robusta TaxID=568900 RepID=A0A9N8HXZ4_9STRA|nr:Leukotriene-B(4) omega-hydroxylase 2 [Seminavis robusta]|eukprot:Sro1901_g304340.1 Leukotriene-B(4) omega-hydroxylase 2 (528) ;mRNA; f:10748-12331